MKQDAGDAGPLQADQARSERLHRFAHDLKNRLNGLGTALRMLDDLAPGAERDEVRDYAERSYYKALYDLEVLLDDMGVERGPRAAQITPIDLAALTRSVAAELAYRLERKQQQLVLELPEPLAVEGDPDLIHQILTTLLSNASKFSHPGATITVHAERHGDDITLTVSDPGVGLAAEDLPQVFKAYAWLTSVSTSGEEQGRGSLARALRAARAHGGTLEVHSEGPGKGSSFRLRLGRG